MRETLRVLWGDLRGTGQGGFEGGCFNVIPCNHIIGICQMVCETAVSF